ncbi:unnamed protein product [Sphagnum jensenii]|uniref:Uncharacterized protein n=1 Tax=Sphagnum jensenii TaxID=128206 RepID=A0ABP1BZ05_9BRYO
MLNATSNDRILSGLVRSNGLPRGHADLNGGHRGLNENLLEGVMIPEVFPTSFRPEVVQNETTKNVQWLPGVSETPGVVGKEPRRVVVVFDGRFAEENKGPGDCNVVRRLPFVLNSFIRFLGALRHGALQ